MYSPKYTITNNILKNIGVVEACKEVIENAPLVPAYEKRFKEDALIRIVHHGTRIEGNDLSFAQAERVILDAKGETSAKEAVDKTGITARERDVQEVINYRNVIDYLGELYETHKKEKKEDFRYSESQIKEIHKKTVHRLITDENQGVYRTTQVVLRDSRSGEITFRPPPAVEVPYLMEDFVYWMNHREGREVHSVLKAGIAHYAIAAIHPFVEGNGRTARAFATLVLFVEEYDIRRLCSLEEYFDKDAETYYKTLIATSNQSKDLTERDLTSWLEYFTYGLSLELARVRDKVRKLSVDSRIKVRRGEQVLLSERQIKIVEYLSENEKVQMRQLRDLFPKYSDDALLRDVQIMIKKGIIRKRGSTKAAYYELVT